MPERLEHHDRDVVEGVSGDAGLEPARTDRPGTPPSGRTGRRRSVPTRCSRARRRRSARTRRPGSTRTASMSRPAAGGSRGTRTPRPPPGTASARTPAPASRPPCPSIADGDWTESGSIQYESATSAPMPPPKTIAASTAGVPEPAPPHTTRDRRQVADRRGPVTSTASSNAGIINARPSMSSAKKSGRSTLIAPASSNHSPNRSGPSNTLTSAGTPTESGRPTRPSTARR